MFCFCLYLIFVVIPLLGQLITDVDFNSRERASKALAIAAADACGILAILSQGVVLDILKGVFDPTVEVRKNVYECIYNVTRLPEGIDACVDGNASSSLVNNLPNEDPRVQPMILRTIQNLVRTAKGLSEVGLCKGVNVCIEMLKSSDEEVIVQVIIYIYNVMFVYLDIITVKKQANIY